MHPFHSPTPARRLRLAAAALCCAATLAACGNDDDDDNDLTGPGSTVPAGRTIFGVDAGNNLVAFGAQNPTTTAARRIPITGLTANESIIGIDFRSTAPVTAAADRRLYGATTANRIVTIDTTTGAAVAVGTAAFTPPLQGTAFGFDFNPVADRIRVHSDQDQDLRLNQTNGTVAATDIVLAYALGDPNVGQNPNVVGTAYTNSVAGATATELFAIDSDRDALVFLADPNSGRLATRGLLGVNTTQDVGFDIYGAGLAAAPTAQAYATLTPVGSTRSRLYSINLASGVATAVGDVNSNRPLIGISITP
jgi:hypothetical protein